MTLATTLLGVNRSGEIIRDPSPAVAKAATSLHAISFSSKGHLLMNESLGRFDFDTWELVRQQAATICRGAATPGSDEDAAMGGTDNAHVDGFVRETVEDHLHRDYNWKLESI